MRPIRLKPTALKISAKLLASINKSILDNNINNKATYLTLNFRDSTYSSEEGGYHPVEIALQKNISTGTWEILYITNFSYYGHPYPELVKSLDFDFSIEMFFGVHCSARAFSGRDVKEVFKMWQQNFLSYLEFEAFDQIIVSAE